MHYVMEVHQALFLYVLWIWVILWQKYLPFQQLDIEIGLVVKWINSESAKIQNVLIKELKTSCELSWRFTSLCLWLVFFSLLKLFGETTNSAQWRPLAKTLIVPAALHVPSAADSLLCSRDIFGWDLQGWSWHLVLAVLPGSGMWVFWDQEFEDVCDELPGCARRMPVSSLWLSRILSFDSPRRQDCFIVIAPTTLRQEASLWLGTTGGSVVCCLFIVWSWHWPAQGATCWFQPTARTTVPEIKDAYFLCFVDEKSF